MPNTQTVVNKEQARANLDKAIQQELRTTHARLVSQDDTTAVIHIGEPISHILHLVLTLLTVGWWGIVWLFIIVTKKTQLVRLSVDEIGFVSRTMSTHNFLDSVRRSA